MSKTNDKDDTTIKASASLEAKNRGERLRFVRKVTGMFTESFGKLCGVGRTTVSSWEQGISALTERGAEKVVNGVRSEGIHCTKSWLLLGIGEPPKIIAQEKLSKLNYQTLSGGAYATVKESVADYTGSQLEKEIGLFKNCFVDVLVHRITDHTMHPNYRYGDWVGGITLSQDTLDLAHDIDCIVELTDGRIMTRRIKTEAFGSSKLSLYGVNAETSIEYPPLRYLLASQIKSLAPIIRVWRQHLEVST